MEAYEQFGSALPVRKGEGGGMSEHIRHDHEELLESLKSGKLPRNLTWSAVVDLIGAIGEVEAHGNDEFSFLVGSQKQRFKKPSTHDLGVEKISRLRTFLKRAEADANPLEAVQPGRMVVVIDHHAAHIYQDTGESMPQDEVTAKPYDPFGFHHHLIHRKEAHYKGEHVPEENSYYEEIAKDILHAQSIVLIGHGVGKSSAVESLSAFLKTHHPETFRRIIATETADLSAITEPQIEEIARKHLRVAPLAAQ
jgi:hypothetical protein